MITNAGISYLLKVDSTDNAPFLTKTVNATREQGKLHELEEK